MTNWDMIVGGIAFAWIVFMWWKPSWVLHPVLTYHRIVLKHQQEMVPVGFADWDLHCSCGKEAEL